MNPQQEREVKLALQQLEARLAGMTAAIAGLAGQVHQVHGKDGVQAAKEKALTATNTLFSSFGPRPDRAVIDAIFDPYLK